MRTEQKTNIKNSVGRLIVVVLSVLIQVLWIIILFLKLNTYSTAISLFCILLTLIVALRIYGKHTNAAFKMPWIILLLTFPILGLCIYLIFGHSRLTTVMQKRFRQIIESLSPFLKQDPAVMKTLEEKDFGVANQCRYISDYAGYPVYQNTDVVFYKDTSDALEALLEALAAAERFIFMEYHAIEDASAFARIKTVLTQKAKEGVEVADRIQCRVFNPIMPLINIFMNNRDHRKITVIDNKIGFTGGYNLADEYFNITHPYGHWKDSGVRITGDAVQNLTEMFLEMWNVMKKTDEDYSKYLKPIDYTTKESGFVQPYADSPLDDEYTGENVYLNLIKYARHKLYVTTPYLIISDEMNRELVLAAKRGVDVRIITPGIPDKKVVYKLTRSYYAGLATGGVRIYEYTPGFLHAKQFLCDDTVATVGTINLDYRSLYHHFENSVFLYGYDAIHDISADFDELFAKSTEVTSFYSSGRSTMLRISQCILRLFAPLL